MSPAMRSSGTSWHDAGHGARTTSCPTWPAAPNSRTFTEGRLPRGRGFELLALREQLVEILDGAGQPLSKVGRRLPAKQGLRGGDIGAALDRVVDRQRPSRDQRARTGHLDDDLGEL